MPFEQIQLHRNSGSKLHWIRTSKNKKYTHFHRKCSLKYLMALEKSRLSRFQWLLKII